MREGMNNPKTIREVRGRVKALQGFLSFSFRLCFPFLFKRKPMSLEKEIELYLIMFDIK
jgi:hypothetical protein